MIQILNNFNRHFRTPNMLFRHKEIGHTYRAWQWKGGDFSSAQLLWKNNGRITSGTREVVMVHNPLQALGIARLPAYGDTYPVHISEWILHHAATNALIIRTNDDFQREYMPAPAGSERIK